VDVEELVEVLKACVYIMYTLPIAICEIFDLRVHHARVSRGVWTCKGCLLLLGFGECFEGFGS
jgi:hypothetical protein